jgi:hypothetical protein
MELPPHIYMLSGDQVVSGDVSDPVAHKELRSRDPVSVLSHCIHYPFATVTLSKTGILIDSPREHGEFEWRHIYLAVPTMGYRIVYFQLYIHALTAVNGEPNRFFHRFDFRFHTECDPSQVLVALGRMIGPERIVGCGSNCRAAISTPTGMVSQ